MWSKAAVADAQPSMLSGVFKRPFAEQVAFFRQKLGNLVPTRRWDDIKKSAHDRGFMVAGAAKADLLADLAAAVDRVVSEGKGIEAFRTDFRATVERNGWHGWTGEGTKKGEAWRTRVIYTTNAATSYSAGRLSQLKEGGFDLWVYRHADGVKNPRPQHLAWDGLTLPPDDPFWKAHYPPNGWGCGCYVVGARSDAGAKRLGGEPEKDKPENWNAIDEKTGAPVGIDKGWDYAPGDTVSATVQQMAAKTQQWDYTLAKAYMQSVPAAVRDQLARSYRALPSVADDARRYAARVLEEKTGVEIPPYRTLGLLTALDAAAVRGFKGIDASLYDYALDASAIGHIRRQHGDAESEAKRGQRAVTAADYARLPQLLNAPDAFEDAGSTIIGRPLVRISKRFGDETLVAVFEVRDKRRMLVPVTMYVRKKD